MRQTVMGNGSDEGMRTGDSSLAAAVAMAPFDSRFDSPATTPFDSCPLSVSADSCPAGAP